MKRPVYVVCLWAMVMSLAFSEGGFASPQQDNYKTYVNARFKYSISYPADVLIPQGEAENGDGQIFREKYGSVAR